MSQEHTDQEKLKAMRLKLSFLVHDLRPFKDNPEAENHLNSSTSLHHIGPPYLTDLEATEALATPLCAFRALSENVKHDVRDQETLGKFLDDRMQEIFQNRRLKGREGGGKEWFCIVHKPWLRTHDEDCAMPQMEIWELQGVQICLCELDKECINSAREMVIRPSGQIGRLWNRSYRTGPSRREKMHWQVS